MENESVNVNSIALPSSSTNQDTSEPEPNQFTNSTKKSIIIKPETAKDMEDLIYVANYKAGAKHREIIARLAQKYGFTAKEYKHGKISISLDFAALKAEQQQQENKNSEGI